MTAAHAWKLGLVAGLAVAHVVCLKVITGSSAMRLRPQATQLTASQPAATPIWLIAKPQRIGNVPSLAGGLAKPHQDRLQSNPSLPTDQGFSAPSMIDPGDFLPSTAMDRRPTPVSEPDVAALQGLRTSGFPVRLRIYIDRFGAVVHVETLEAGLLDEEFALGLHKMFFATAFIPGQLDGSDVASFLEIELVGQ